jgi:2,5-furandicarboxylate decarboxylase 1
VTAEAGLAQVRCGLSEGRPTGDTHDLRGWLAHLGERGELRTVTSEIDPDQDVAAVLEHADGRYAVWFDTVRGSKFPLVGNTVTARAHFALAMRCPPGEVTRRLATAIAAPRACAVIDPAAAPVLAVRDDGGDLLSDLPLPVQHEHDGGRYLTSAVMVARDPRTGKINLSINRLQATGPREFRALMLPGRLRTIFTELEKSGRDLPVALCVGLDPLLLLASQAPADADLDHLEVASALYPEALEVTWLREVDLPVPARAEMLLTGRFRAGKRGEEGPFGEYPRTYGPPGPGPVLELSARHRREDAIAQTILSGSREHFVLGGLPREAHMAQVLSAAAVDVVALRLTEGGSCRMHAVIAVRSARPGTARHAAMAVFTAVPTVKHVVIVDDDVDVFDNEQVEWAIATRTQADRDLLVVPRTIGSSLDPSADGNTTAKLAIDATVPSSMRDRFARMRSASSCLDIYLAELGDPR